MAGGQVTGLHWHADQFRYPDTGCIQQVEHGSVANQKRCVFAWRLQKAFNFGQGKGTGQIGACFGSIKVNDRVVFQPSLARAVGEKSTQGGQPSGLGTAADALLVAGVKKLPEMVGSNPADFRDARSFQKGEKLFYISAIAGDSIVCKTALQYQVL